MSRALVGTSGWNYPTGRGSWNGIFYPRRRPRGFDELAYYAEHFDTVEVNSSFYRVPSVDQATAWIERTPADFQFSVKLYQKFTHPDMYLAKSRGHDWDVSLGDRDEFRRALAPIADAGRLAALLIQFPAGFHADQDTRAYLDWLLRAFGDLPLAVELRHTSWTEDSAATTTLLDEHRAAWVLADAPRIAELPAPAQGAESAAGLMYIRLHGRNAGRWWAHDESADRYDYLYSPAELAPLADTARNAAARGRRVVMYLNNHFSAKAVANAAVLKHQLGDLVPGEYSRDMVALYPQLEGIVTPSGLPI